MIAHAAMLNRFYEPSVREAVSAQFTAADPQPVLLHDVLDPGLANNVVDELEASTAWQRDCFVEEFLGSTRRVSQAEFRAASRLARFATWEALPLARANQLELSALWAVTDALSDAAFVDHLRNLGEPGVATPSIKVRRYRPGDFFSPHSDGNTGVGLLIYLTKPDWRPGNGGRFMYEGEGAEPLRFEPTFNSALMFPYRERAMHWVEPMASDAGPRYTLGFDYT